MKWIDYSTHPIPICDCGECDDPELEGYPRRFECSSCHRSVPWCYGASDDYPELCDACAVQVSRAEEEICS